MVDIRLRRKEIFGKWSMELRNEDGKQTSRSSGSGDLTPRFSSNENEVFIETGHRQFQLVYFPGLDQWMGNVLESAKGVYKKSALRFSKEGE